MSMLPGNNSEPPKLRLVHYSSQEVKRVLPHAQRPDDFKPRGFWVSDEGCEHNWQAWCLAEGFNLESLTHVHTVEVAPGARLLILSSGEEIERFTQTFGHPGKNERHDIFLIDWDQVRAQYDGLIITPYIWEKRLDLLWYYGWDCASGCLWNPDVVKIKLIQVSPVPAAVQE
jgi:hypothetical protein